jgi:hypothetical protein
MEVRKWLNFDKRYRSSLRADFPLLSQFSLAAAMGWRETGKCLRGNGARVVSAWRALR